MLLVAMYQAFCPPGTITVCSFAAARMVFRCSLCSLCSFGSFSPFTLTTHFYRGSNLVSLLSINFTSCPYIVCGLIPISRQIDPTEMVKKGITGQFQGNRDGLKWSYKYYTVFNSIERPEHVLAFCIVLLLLVIIETFSHGWSRTAGAQPTC